MEEKIDKCIYSDLCGGCQLQGKTYQKQLEYKQNKIYKLLSKYQKVNKIIGMDNPLNYRNKVQVSFGYDDNKNVICGNYVNSTHTIVPIEDCMICDIDALKIIQSIKRLVIKYKISIFNEDSLRGCLRHILIRTTNTKQIMLVLVTGTSNINKKDLFLKDILKFNPNITTIVQNINNRHTSMILGEKNITLYGKGYIYDELCGLRFRISPSSFYQVNKRQTETLYKQAIEYAGIKKSDVIIDAYCGTGTIGLVASKYAKKVIGVEINKAAVKDAIINMKNNNINNCEFINEDAGKFMNYLAKKKVDIDIVIMDPPRTGSDMKFINAIFALKPRKVIYVSCGPETLARDLKVLSKYYDVKTIQPVDMFPYTEHVETVVLLSKVQN